MFEVNELLKATGGKLLQGKKSVAVGGISTDSRTIKEGEAFIAIRGGRFNGHDFISDVIEKGARCVIVDDAPGVRTQSGTIIKVKDTTKALGDIARFRRQRFDIPVIAVTGSNGKTTAKDMVAWVLSAKYKVLANEGTKNNQIGLPTALLQLDSSYDVAVLELGTNHFGEIAYLAKIALPNVGVITNIGPSHLEYFKNLAGVFKEKYTLVRHLEDPYLLVLNGDDPLLRKDVLKKSKRPFTVGYGISSCVDFSASAVTMSASRLEFTVNGRQKFVLNTVGRHNVYNALVAIAISRIFGLEYPDIAQRLAGFTFLPGRLNLIEHKNVRFIDDTYNSNPFSLVQAMDSLKRLEARGRKIVIMGDMLELGKSAEDFHKRAGEEAARICDVLITVGPLSKFAAQAAKEAGFDAHNLFSCGSSSEAGNILFQTVMPVPEDIILIKGSRSMKMEEVLRANAI